MDREYTHSPQEVLASLQSCPTGLTEEQAAERLRQHGPNKLKEAEKPSVFQRFLAQLQTAKPRSESGIKTVFSSPGSSSTRAKPASESAGRSIPPDFART